MNTEHLLRAQNALANFSAEFKAETELNSVDRYLIGENLADISKRIINMVNYLDKKEDEK